MVAHLSGTRPGSLILITFATLVGALVPPGIAEAERSPHYQGKSLPTPPHQDAPWSPPEQNGLPASLIGATTTLFDQGFADPRNCEYRIIKVVMGNCWTGDAGIGAVHGWVLPGDETGALSPFAVCWNGLVYPVVEIGDKANVDDDVQDILKRNRSQRVGPSPGRAWEERHSISHETFLPVKICLLLRLDKRQLTEEYWSAYRAALDQQGRDYFVRWPYYYLARDWTWGLLDRALGAHMRGDDRLALLSARKLVRVRTMVEEETNRSGFDHRHEDGLYHPHLLPIHRLLQDQERRAKLAARNEQGLQPNRQSERIEWLIDKLDESKARQSSQPGGISWNIDGDVQALVNEGEAAVDALIRCLEKDNRLTRGVSFSRDFGFDRRLHSVKVPAFAALRKILQMDSLGGEGNIYGTLIDGTVNDQQKAAAKIRSYWLEYVRLKPIQRWYKTLADDTAGDREWLQSAQNLSRGQLTPELRTELEPGVFRLMTERIDDLSIRVGQEITSSDDMFRMHVACRLALVLAEWDLNKAVPILKTQAQRCRHAADHWQNSWTAQILHHYSAQFTLKRVQANDMTALQDYAAWIQELTPDRLDSYLEDALKPLLDYPENSHIAGAAERMFNDTASPWNPLLDYETQQVFSAEALFKHEGLTKLASFRTQLKRVLKDTHVVGTVTIIDETSIRIAIPKVGIKGQGKAMWNGALPKPGTTFDCRVCDMHAYLLSRHKEFPKCELFWSKVKRDTAVAACLERLESADPCGRLGHTKVDHVRNQLAVVQRDHHVGCFKVRMMQMSSANREMSDHAETSCDPTSPTASNQHYSLLLQAYMTILADVQR